MKFATNLLFPAILCVMGCSHEITGASGVLVDQSGSGISDATIELYDRGFYKNGAPRSTSITKEDGTFSVLYSEKCGFHDCLGGGYLVGIAEGYETQYIKLSEMSGDQFHSGVVLMLPDYDGLPAASTGIPDEQPRLATESTRVSQYNVKIPQEGSFQAQLISSVTGSCENQITEHGRSDEYDCASIDGVDYSPCFHTNDDTLESEVVCRPDGIGSNHRYIHMTLSAPLPAGDDFSQTDTPIPRSFIFNAGRNNFYNNCERTSEPLQTNEGDRIGYVCEGDLVTWALTDFERGDIWSVTRIGVAKTPSTEIVEVLGKRRIQLLSILF